MTQTKKYSKPVMLPADDRVFVIDGERYYAKLATVESTMLGFTDRGIFTASIGLDFVNCSQTIGGYVLGFQAEDGHHDLCITKSASEFIMRVLSVFGEGARWESLKGRHVYALAKKFQNNTMPDGIGPIEPDVEGTAFLFKPWQDRATYERELEETLTLLATRNADTTRVKVDRDTDVERIHRFPEMWIPGWLHTPF